MTYEHEHTDGHLDEFQTRTPDLRPNPVSGQSETLTDHGSNPDADQDLLRQTLETALSSSPAFEKARIMSTASDATSAIGAMMRIEKNASGLSEDERSQLKAALRLISSIQMKAVENYTRKPDSDDVVTQSDDNSASV